jgi:hypothetical protein
MAWNGYFEFAGNEIINLPRSEAYARDSIWFRTTGEGQDLPLMTGEGSYHTPMVDDAPWTDPDDPASYDFWGYYPLDVSGIEDATVSSTVVESTGDGGVPGRVRRGTKTVVFNGLLLAASDCGADYGIKWLRSILIGNPCSGNAATLTCNGDDLCYLPCEPQVDHEGSGDPTDCWDLRSLRRVVFNTGPTVTAKRTMSDGGATWMVTFTAVAGSPYEFGQEQPIVVGFMDPLVTNPYPPGITGVVDLNGVIVDETGCAVEVSYPIFDPLCPALVVPPSVPSVPLGCYSPPGNWHRRQFTIPNTMIRVFSDAVPLIKVYARDTDIRNCRLRFYSDVNGDGSIVDDVCSWCGDIVLSYIPEDMTLVFDGSDETIYIETPGGGRRRADNLVYATDGGPFEWPALSCGFGYIVTVDLPQTQTPPVLDFSLFDRVA